MAPFLEVWRAGLPEVVTLERDELSIGASAENAVAIAGDATVSALHAVIRRVGPRWCLTDVGSRNGTTVNGRPVTGMQVLSAGDELRLGATRIVFRDDRVDDAAGRTVALEPAPTVTPREHDILAALCAPLVTGGAMRGPASVVEIAAALVVTESAVKKHLARLYHKFGIDDGERHKRGRLASEALRRGAISIVELRK